MRIALYEPDIPQNTGTIMRLCACMGLALDIIEPCSFILSDRNLKRAGMDYLEHLDMTRHASWQHFREARAGSRLVLMTTKAEKNYLDFQFGDNDILIAGRASGGVRQEVHDACDAGISIHMTGGLRSLNVAIATAMIAGEALRQLRPS